MKEFQKSVSIWWGYVWNTPDSYFSGHGVNCINSMDFSDYLEFVWTVIADIILDFNFCSI